jgi:hypothetical protein
MMFIPLPIIESDCSGISLPPLYETMTVQHWTCIRCIRAGGRMDAPDAPLHHISLDSLDVKGIRLLNQIQEGK